LSIFVKPTGKQGYTGMQVQASTGGATVVSLV